MGVSVASSSVSLSVIGLILFRSRSTPGCLGYFGVVPPYFSFRSRACFEGSILRESFFSVPFFYGTLAALFSITVST